MVTVTSTTCSTLPNSTQRIQLRTTGPGIRLRRCQNSTHHLREILFCPSQSQTSKRLIPTTTKDKY